MERVDLSNVKRYSIKERKHKVNLTALVTSESALVAHDSKIESDPNFTEFCSRIISARKADRAVVFGMGGHVIKTGCGPLLANLVRRDMITHIACNMSAAIHDFELAMYGMTSEYVEDTLKDGMFGFVEETGKEFNLASQSNQSGLGESLGAFISKNAPHKDISLLSACFSKGAPALVFTCVGAETVYQHPECKPEVLGKKSGEDFLRFAAALKNISGGGVYANFGSAVVMPEVFLKALSIAKNLYGVSRYYTANFDMLPHYRPTENVLKRPTLDSGKSYDFRMRHEQSIPALFSSLMKE